MPVPPIIIPLPNIRLPDPGGDPVVLWLNVATVAIMAAGVVVISVMMIGDWLRDRRRTKARERRGAP